MSRGPYRFTENEVARALRAAAKCGPDFYVRVEHSTGDILILPGAPAPVQSPQPSAEADPTPEAALEGWLKQNGVSGEAPGRA
jgi:hypothetical protein